MKLVILLAAGALAISVPAPAQPQMPYDAGVAARLAGDNDRAITLLEQAVAREPDNSDATLQLGLALLAAGRLGEAERMFRRTLELAPNYKDATDALERLAGRRSAERRLAYRWQLDLDSTYSALDGHQSDWVDGSIRLRRKFDRGTAVTAAIEPSRRFGVGDVYSELRADQRLSSRVNGWIAAGGGPHADFRPKWQLSGGGTARLTDGPYATVLGFDARAAGYRAGEIAAVDPALQQYVGGDSWVTVEMINVFADGRRQSGWLARGDWTTSSRTRLFAGAANGPDTSEGVVRRVFSLFAGITADVTDKTTLRFSLAHENRANSTHRLAVSTGVGVRF